jgi:hypothetical protein
MIGACALAGISFGLLWFSTPEDVPVTDDPPFVGVSASNAGGSITLEVLTSNPIAIADESQRIELSFTVSGTAGSTTALVLGGAFAKADPNCVGAAFDLEPTSSMVAGDSLWRMLTSYYERRPGTGKIYGQSGISLVGEEAAATWVTSQQLLVARNVQLANPTTTVWQPDTTREALNFELASATLTCTFDQQTLVDRTFTGSRFRFRTPDLIASHSNPGMNAIVDVKYEMDLKTDEPMSEFRSTFGDTTQRVDSAGAIVTTYSNEWWWRDAEQEAGITLSGGTSVREAADAQSTRSKVRLGAGLVASLAVAAATLTIAFAVGWSKWAKE